MKRARMNKAWILVASIVSCAVFGARAHAGEMGLRASAVSQTPHMLRVDGGLGLGLGLGAVTYGYSPRSWFRLEAGAGFGIVLDNDSPKAALMVSLMPKFSVGSERHRFVFGAGVSGGFSKDENALFLNVDVAGYEYRADNGFTFSASAGTSTMVGGEGIALVFPQVRIGMGYRF